MALSWARNGVWALAVLVLGGAAAYALLVGKPEPVAEIMPEIEPPLVEVVTAAPGVRRLSVSSQGTVRPLRQIKLMSQVGGRVERVSPRFSEGSFFSAGEPLVKIEDIDYQLQIARAESQVAAAKQVLAQEQGRALQAKREWRDLGAAEANALFLREPQIAAAEASLTAAEADLTGARLDLQRTAIAVPFNGRISEKYVDVGQFVAPGTHVATVYATDAVEVRLPLTGRQVALLDLPLNYDDAYSEGDQGAAVLLRARFANRDWEWQGRVVRTDASIDESSRLVYAVVEVDMPFARDPESDRPPLSPGLFVSAQISGREMAQVAELPRSALRSDDSVLVVGPDQTAIARSVQVLDRNAGNVWVQGLEQGDRVVVASAGWVVAGTRVAVQPATELVTGH